MSSIMEMIKIPALAVFFSVATHAQVPKVPPADSFQREFAISICESPDSFREKFDLTAEKSKERKVIYFDTGDRAFYKNGLIVRLRHNGKKADLTVKVRPFDTDRLPSDFPRSEGFKCEWDVNRDGETFSCSDKQKLSAEEAGRIMTSGKVADSLRESQWRLVALAGKQDLDWAALTAYGPMETWLWEEAVPSLSAESELQIWRFPKAREVIEASFRTSPDEFVGQKSAFLGELQKRSVRLCEVDISKTELALETRSL